MTCKFCKRKNHTTENCFHKLRRNKNRFKIKNKKPSFQNKALKITEPTKTDIDSKSLSGKISLGKKAEADEIKSGFKSVKTQVQGSNPCLEKNPV